MGLIETGKKFTRRAVLKELGGEILTCDKTREKWDRFEDWAIEMEVCADVDILLEDTFNFVKTFLPSNPWATKWLIDHGFAQEEKAKFQPFSIEVSTPEEAACLWHRLNHNRATFLKHYDNETPIFGIQGIPDKVSFITWDKVDVEIKKQGGLG